MSLPFQCLSRCRLHVWRDFRLFRRDGRDSRTVCSVCENGFIGTSDFRCVDCSGKSTGTVVTVVGSLLAVIALTILAFFMISGNNISSDLDGRLPNTTASWRRPLQSLKIVIVAWQILTQVQYAQQLICFPLKSCRVQSTGLNWPSRITRGMVGCEAGLEMLIDVECDGEP